MKIKFTAILFLLFAVYAQAQTFFTSVPEISNVTSIIDWKDEVWIATYGKGIYMYDRATEKWETYSSQYKNIESDFIYCVAVSDDYIWAGTSDGLITITRNNNQWRKRKFAAGGEYGNWIRALAYSSTEQRLYIGRFKNLSTFNVRTQRFDDYDLTYQGDAQSNTIKTIDIENDRWVWVGTESGLYKYDNTLSIESKNSFTYYNNKSGSFRGDGESVSISRLLINKSFVWVGTEEFVTRERPEFNLGGLYRFNRRATWDKFDTKTGLPANGIRALALTGNYIWISVYEFDIENKFEKSKGLILINRLTGEPFPIEMEEIKLGTNNITAMYFDGKYLWLGTEVGLWQVRIFNPFAQWAADINTKNSVKKNDKANQGTTGRNKN